MAELQGNHVFKWIIEFLEYEIYRQFVDVKDTTLALMTYFLDNESNRELSGKPEMTLLVANFITILKTVQGPLPVIEDDNQVSLEACIPLYERIFHKYGDEFGENIQRMKLELKVQTVLVFLRKHQTEKAQAMIDTLWPDGVELSMEEKALKIDLKDIVDGNNELLKKFMGYQEFLDQIRELFDELYQLEEVGEPFLLRMEKRLSCHLQSLSQRSDESSQNTPDVVPQNASLDIAPSEENKGGSDHNADEILTQLVAEEAQENFSQESQVEDEQSVVKPNENYNNNRMVTRSQKHTESLSKHDDIKEDDVEELERIILETVREGDGSLDSEEGDETRVEGEGPAASVEEWETSDQDVEIARDAAPSDEEVRSSFSLPLLTTFCRRLRKPKLMERVQDLQSHLIQICAANDNEQDAELSPDIFNPSEASTSKVLSSPGKSLASSDSEKRPKRLRFDCLNKRSLRSDDTESSNEDEVPTRKDVDSKKHDSPELYSPESKCRKLQLTRRLEESSSESEKVSPSKRKKACNGDRMEVPKIQTGRQLRHRKLRKELQRDMGENERQVSWSDEEEGEEQCCTYATPRKSPKKRNFKNPWSAEEVRRLKEGLAIYGEGHWAQIKENCDLPLRTNVDIKDKYRNMVKNGLI